MTNPSFNSISVLGLRSLRTLEAAARHLHFTRAAQELFVTSAAVSHQIKEIESQLGCALFARNGRSVQLTPEGEVIHQAVQEAISVLERGIAQLGAQRNPDRVRVSASPSIAAKWLVPRLEGFLGQYPTADIRVDVSFMPAASGPEEVDLCIRHGAPVPTPPGFQTDLLFTESFFPVCSPRLLPPGDALRRPQDLLGYKLIHIDWASPHATWPGWRTWMASAGLRDVELPSGLHFQQSALALEAAIAGQGIALGEASLVVNDLAAGRLVKPLSADYPMGTDYAYFLMTRQDALAAPMVRAFQHWLLAEARQFQHA